MKIVLSGIGVEEGKEEIIIKGNIQFIGGMIFDTAYPIHDEDGNLIFSNMLIRISISGYFYHKGKNWFNMRIEP